MIAGLILTLGGFWSVGESLKDRAKSEELRYLNGSFHCENVKDPQDKESKGLYLFTQKLDLERK